MAKQLFRSVSLERLSSPEQLDRLMRVTTPKGWLALLVILALLTVAIFWSIFGSIPDRVSGQGILIKSGGVIGIKCLSDGPITDIRVGVGERVERGQVVARIGQPALVDRISKNKASLNELMKKYERVSKFGEEKTRLQAEYVSQQRYTLEQTIESFEKVLKWLEERILNQEQLLKEGLITRQALLRTKEEHSQKKMAVENARNQMKEISVREHDLEKQKRDEVSGIKRQIDDKEVDITLLESKMEVESQLFSPYTGRVLEIGANEGDFLSRGTSVMTIELIGKEIKDLEAILYVLAIDGKKIKPGMNAHISPTTVKREEYGVIRGKVTYVSEFPSTQEGMIRVLGNPQLARQLSGGGAPLEITVDLIPSEETVSGYKWSSPKGPPLKITSGTICRGSIIVARRRPIELVIPILKKFFLGIGKE